jgi:acyl-CoA reductase-like NAD-dependent aldehyde dehydrogenase
MGSNYPVFTPLGSIGYGLAAGNAVVFKPSEHTPAVAAWLRDRFAEVVPEQPVLQLVTGFGATGEALCRAGVDKLVFTGSPATGRKVLHACADRLTPVLLELGGKDAMVVDDDAAATAAVWGAIANAGQTCIGIERVDAVAPVYDRFVEKVVERATRLRARDAADADLGPITMPGQLDVIRRHLDDALARGANALVGGPDSVHPPFAEPVVLVDVPEDALIMREETFGPVLPVVRVRDAEDAAARANASPYGLGGAVFGRRRANALARALRAGMVSVNSVQQFAAVPALPFGGVGESGFGRIHGAQGPPRALDGQGGRAPALRPAARGEQLPAAGADHAAARQAAAPAPRPFPSRGGSLWWQGNRRQAREDRCPYPHAR